MSTSSASQPSSGRRVSATQARTASEPQTTRMDPEFPREGRARVIIEGILPCVDGGRYPIKRTQGEKVVVEADIFADGHDVLSAVLKYREAGSAKWSESPMEPLGNDRWRGEFCVHDVGLASYTVEAWVDHFKSWRHDTRKKRDAGQDLAIEILSGATLLEAAAKRAPEPDARMLRDWASTLRHPQTDPTAALELALSDEVAALMARHPDRRFSAMYQPELRITVDPPLARFGAWYEMFPRSCPGREGTHGTFRDVEAQLPRIASLGFDILYLPPIHPIGRTFRKGKNNKPECEPGDVGSPWGIGGPEGGHKSIHPELGTMADFDRLVQRAGELGVRIALDVAFQCSPDHPYVREHPEWFRKRPDGSIQYAENPPKKYQDIYPIDFESADWRALWKELRSIFEFWIGHGVRVFRVDNPHTKSLRFWEWAIAGLKEAHPEVIFLSEAFTRPKLMYALAKLGFTQSYNYFPWRNTKHELIAYFTELTQTPVREFFRANLWPNTPDILTHYLQVGGMPAFRIRLILAATLGASYGIYGPAFELGVHHPREPGSEEYLNSEKYEVKTWDLDQPGNLSELLRRVNRIRRENSALHSDHSLRFHPIDHDHLLAFSKRSSDPGDPHVILVVVNLDPYQTHHGWVHAPPEEFGLDPSQPFQAHDLLTDARYLWQGTHHYIELNPAFAPAHVFRLRQRVRTERDFDYYL